MEKKKRTNRFDKNKKNNVNNINIIPKKIFDIKKMDSSLILNSSLLINCIKIKIEDINNNYIDVNTLLNNFNMDKLLNYIIELHKNEFISPNLFYKNYLAFVKALNFESISRKLKIDSNLKKCKTKFFKAFQSVLNKLLNEYVLDIKLPKIFVYEIRININKKYLDLPIINIFNDYGIKISSNDIKKYVNNEYYILFVKILQKTYRVLFNEYISSYRFKKDCNCIRIKEGKKFELLFKYVANIFVDYYSNCNGNREKLNKKNK